MKIKVDPGAYVPTRAHDTDAGMDLYSMEEKTIHPRGWSLKEDGFHQAFTTGETFDTGVHMAIPNGYFGKIESRSGLNVKNSVVSCGGVVDSGYTGSIKVKLYNLGTEPYTVHAGDKIAQLIIHQYLAPELELVSHLDETERGDAGFGSTGR